MEFSEDQQLDGLFSHDQPLGPPAIIPEIHAARISDIYFETLTPYSQHVTPAHATYVMGRRGAGKTTLILAADKFDPQGTIPLFESDVLSGMLDLIRHIERDLHFTLSLENRVDLWKATFEFAAATHLAVATEAQGNSRERLRIRHFLTELRRHANLDLTTTTDYVRAFEDYISGQADQHIHGPFHAWVDALSLDRLSVATIRQDARHIISTERRHITIVIDTLEELLNRRAQYSDVLRPLFARLGRQAMTGTRGTGLFLRCCLPSELSSQLAELSDNPSKDFRGICHIRWSTNDLLALVEMRYRQFARALADAGEPTLEQSLKATPSEPRPFLESILPRTVLNSCQRDELTLPFLLRHTQMLPRQVLILFNYILAGRETTQRIARQERLPADITAAAVTTAEHELTMEVLNAFRGYWSGITPALEALVPRLEPTFTEPELHTLFERLGLRRYARSSALLLTRLVKTGVVGRVRERTERYIVGEFDYIYPRGMSAFGAPELCLHPMFSRFHGRTALDHKPIYPAPSPDATADLFE